MPAASIRQPIYLIGYRGTGKSTVALRLAANLGWEWCDADAELEAHFGVTIRHIFESASEADFRAKEAFILEKLSHRERCVIATGGGVVLRPANRAILKQGFVAWLTAPAEIIWQRLQCDATTTERRPELVGGGLGEITELLAVREPLYRECATCKIDTTQREPVEVAETIMAHFCDGRT